MPPSSACSQFDSSHVSWLHRAALDTDPLFKGAKGNQYNFNDAAPQFEIAEAPGGLFIGARRKAESGNFYWRITPWVMPCYTIVPPRADHPVHGHFWVPIDDHTCWTWSFDFHPTRALSIAEIQAMRDGKGVHVTYVPGTYRPRANKANAYLMDRGGQKAGRSFSGVEGIAMQDASLQESMGPIADRTRENLVGTDNGIIMARNRLLRAAEALAAGAVGNLLEWYDFGLYGLFAPVLAPLFFPSADPLASLIGAYGGFALGFAVRPLGGAVLGHLGDRIGRGFVLIASVVLMGAATSAMALLPSYHRIGIAAPILLLLVRILQGFSVGGEFTGSVCYLVETAPPGRRGLAGSFANIGSTSGVLLAAGIAAATVTLAGDTPAREWAWRLPFLFGGVLALLAYLVRRRLIHSGPTPKIPASKDQPPPLRQALRQSPRAMVYAVLFTSGYGVVNYLTMVFLPTFASQFGGIAESTTHS